MTNKGLIIYVYRMYNEGIYSKITYGGKVMKRKLFSFLLVFTFLVVTSNSYVFANSISSGKIVIQKEDYSQMQMDNETVFNKVEEGTFVNNEYTRVNQYTQDNGNTKVVNITRKLDKEVFNDGEIVENYSSTSLVSILAIVSGNKEETYTSGSYTFQLVEGFNYQRQSFDNGTTLSYKITNYYVKPVLLDSSFTFTKLYLQAEQNGTGYNDNATPALKDTVSKFTINSPVSNTKYSADTGFTWYVNLNDGSGGGTYCTIYYSHGSSSYRYTYYVYL